MTVYRVCFSTHVDSKEMGASKKGWENAHHAYLPVSYDLNQWSCLKQPEQSIS